MCEPYKAQGADIYGYCVYRYVGGIRTIDQLADYCAGAGDWEEKCRHAWVSGMSTGGSNFTTEALLGACGGNIDCTFELIDNRYHPDVLIQIGRCGRYVGRYAGDCTSHAMQRWYQSKPSLEEFNRVVVFDGLFFDKVGYWAGAVVQCHDVGVCPDNKRVGQFCTTAQRKFERQPSDCPPLSKAPLPHHKDKVPKKRTPQDRLTPAARGQGPGLKHGPPNGATPPVKRP